MYQQDDEVKIPMIVIILSLIGVSNVSVLFLRTMYDLVRIHGDPQRVFICTIASQVRTVLDVLP